jgi:hypothetical protein
MGDIQLTALRVLLRKRLATCEACRGENEAESPRPAVRVKIEKQGQIMGAAQKGEGCLEGDLDFSASSSRSCYTCVVRAF